MPRPARSIWVPRTYSRRRHRSWMWSMCLASVGWGAWWIALLGSRIEARIAGELFLGASILSELCALCGLAIAALTIRARRTWLVFVAVPVLANAALLAMPWLVRGALVE